MAKSKPKLKPCPFGCVSERLIGTTTITYSWGPTPKKRYHVFCMGCQAYGPRHILKHRAIKLWNTRRKVVNRGEVS